MVIEGNVNELRVTICARVGWLSRTVE
jgi:hypothetical protein